MRGRKRYGERQYEAAGKRRNKKGEPEILGKLMYATERERENLIPNNKIHCKTYER